MLVLIYFKKAGVYAPMKILPRYVWWNFLKALASRDIRCFIRSVWAPKWHQKMPSHVEHLLAVAKVLGVDSGWVRWDTDGTRRQVFDPWRDGACKISKQGAFLDVSDEVELRKALGDLSPRILKHDPVQRAYVEEWVDAKSGRCSLDELERVRCALVTSLYQVEERDITSYFNHSDIEFSSEARNLVPVLARLLKRSTLPISVVHGDLVCSNIAFRKNGDPVLYDWEYARRCVVTQDVWFFLYHRYSTASESPELSGILEEFASNTAWAFSTMPDIRALHLVHLFEREALLIRNSEFVDSHQALKKVQKI